MSVLQALDLRRRSASNVPPPAAGKPAAVEVAKLIDVSKCIGCKACQTACLEWNDLNQAIGYTDEYDLSLWFRKARALYTAWGSPAEHRARVVEAL